MEGANVSALVAKLRAAGVDLWVEGGVIRSRWRDGGRPPYGVAVMLADLRDLGMIAVDYLEREENRGQVADSNAKPDASGEPADQRAVNETLDTLDGFDHIRAADGSVLPEPGADGIVRLVRVPPEVAFAAGDLINDGKAELIGKVVYRRLSNVFDVTYRVLEP